MWYLNVAHLKDEDEGDESAMDLGVLPAYRRHARRFSCWRTCQISDVLTSSPCLVSSVPRCEWWAPPMGWMPKLKPPFSRRANQSRKSGRRRKVWATASNCLLLWALRIPHSASSPCAFPFSPFFFRVRLGNADCFFIAVCQRCPRCCRLRSFPLLFCYLCSRLRRFSSPFSSSMAEDSEEETYRQQLSPHSNVCLGFGNLVPRSFPHLNAIYQFFFGFFLYFWFFQRLKFVPFSGCLKNPTRPPFIMGLAAVL